MKITNKTMWNTRHLKAILQRAAEQEFDDGSRRKRLHVTVTYTRGGGCSGYAWYDSNQCLVRIANPRGKTVHYETVPLDDPRKAVCYRSDPAHPKELDEPWSHADYDLEDKVTKAAATHSKVVAVRRPLLFDVARLKLQFAAVACHEFAHCRGMRHARMPSYYKWGKGWKVYVAWAADMPLELAAVRAKPAPTADVKLAHVDRRLKAALTRLKRAKTVATKWEKKRRYYLKRLNTLPVVASAKAGENVE